MRIQMANNPPKSLVTIILGSISDEDYLSNATKILDDFGIPFDCHFCSAHREHSELHKILQASEDNGVKVIIAGAGLSAHLPGAIASHTLIPVIGVPIPAGTLGGLDSLLSIVQMPKGVPVATVGIGRMDNAALLAAQIIASGGDREIQKKLMEYRAQWNK